MKKYIYIIMCGMMSFTLIGCHDFLDVNTDPDTPITITLDQAIPTACFYASQINYDHAEYGVYMCQALTTGGKSQNCTGCGAEVRYSLRDDEEQEE